MSKILLVEDDKDIIENLSAVLRAFRSARKRGRRRLFRLWRKKASICFFWTYP